MKLSGHVAIKNQKGDKFNTEVLYWNEATQKVYSDKFIRIEQTDRIITGHGFDSNQQMTLYTIRNIEGIFYVDEDAIKNDSLKNNKWTFLFTLLTMAFLRSFPEWK